MWRKQIDVAQRSIRTVILRPDRDLHRIAAEADVRDRLHRFTVITELVETISGSAVIGNTLRVT